MDHQLSQKQFGHSSKRSLCGHGLRPSQWHSLSTPRQMAETTRQNYQFYAPYYSHCTPMVLINGNNHFLPRPYSFRSPHGAQPSNPSESSLDRSLKHTRTHTGDKHCETQPSMVAETRKCYVWRPPTASTANYGAVVGRKLPWLRSSSSRLQYSPNLRHVRHMVNRSKSSSHKLQGVTYSSSGTQTVRTSSDQSESSLSHRQCHSFELHKQKQRAQEPQSSCNMPVSTSVVSSSSNQVESSSYQGFSECSYRLSESERDNHHFRMVSTPSSSAANQSSVAGQTPNRSLRHKHECKIAPLCVSCARSSGSGSGCSQHGLGWHDSVCLSPPVNSTPGTEQNHSTQLPSVPHSPELASVAMVPQDPEPAGGCSSAHTNSQEITQTARNPCLPSKSTLSGLTRVQTIKQCLIARGFSPEAASNISEKNRDTSNSCYEKYWQRYVSWCHRSAVNPILASVTDIANFLTHLINIKEFVPTTVDCIKSCITLTLRFCTGNDFTTSIELTALLQKYHRECPPDLYRLPSWNLVLVLEMLNGYPFEPLHEESLKHLTYKCVFLLCISCSLRVSELHALAFDKIKHTPDWQTVYLEPKSDFLAKNQKSHSLPQTRCFKLKALVKPANKTHFQPGSEEETKYQAAKLFCPVRALRLYLARTTYRRTPQKAALFLSLNANHKSDITKQSISNWVRHTIKLCYALAGENPSNIGRASVHEIRAISSSVQFERSLSLTSLMKSCVWKNGNTFTRYYLRNVAVLSDDLYQFPPMWFSQGIINE